jgi:hypothetical protein
LPVSTERDELVPWAQTLASRSIRYGDVAVVAAGALIIHDRESPENPGRASSAPDPSGGPPARLRTRYENSAVSGRIPGSHVTPRGLKGADFQAITLSAATAVALAMQKVEGSSPFIRLRQGTSAGPGGND